MFGRDGSLGEVGDAWIERILLVGNQHAGAEAHALGLHLLDAAVDQMLLHFEIGNAIAQQAANAVILFEHRDGVTRARELLRGGHASGTATDYCDCFAGLGPGRLRCDPTRFPALIDDEMLDRLDADRIIIDVQRAGGFARGRADAPGELGEIVGRVQYVERFAIVAAIDQIIPVGNDVVDRAAVVAKRDAAVHAARALLFRCVVSQMHDEFAIVLFAQLRRFVGFFLALQFEESGDFAHALSLNFLCREFFGFVRCFRCGLGVRRRP